MAIAMNEGIRRKKGLWAEKGQQLEALSFMPWTTRRRQESLELLDQLDPNTDELSQAIKQEAEQVPEVKLLMSHPGVGPITALCFRVGHRYSGTVWMRQAGSYLGLIPGKASSADHWRLGHITKQGNKLLRSLLGQSAQSVARCEEQWHRQYAHLTMRPNKLIAKVAMARKLAVRLFWMWRKGWAFGVLAAILAAVGLYGVMAYMVARGTNEIGIRMALGAAPIQMLEMVLGEAGKLCGVGVAVGIVVTLAIGRWAASLLFGLKPYDPAMIATACLGLAAVAVLASTVPARRAAKLLPMVALREA